MPSRPGLKTNTRAISSVVRNSAKSMGYLVTDIFKEYNPVISELYTNTKDTSEELYQAIKDFNGPDLRPKNVGKELTETSKAIWSNFKEDMQTGNWYNSARQEKVVDVMGMMGFSDDDFNFDLDDDDWGDFDFDDDEDDDVFEDDTKAILSENQKSTKEVIASVDRTGYAVASSVNQGQLQSAGMIVEAGNQQTQAMYSLNQKGFTAVTEAIAGLNNTIGTLGKLGEPLTAHMQNSGVFFTKTTEQLDNINAKLDQLIKNTTIATSDGNGKDTRNKSFSDLLGGGGFVDISDYLSMVKENFKDDKDFVDMITGAFKHVNLKNISPGVLIARGITHAVIPKMFKDTMEEFNKSIKYTINDLFLKGTYKMGDSANLLTMFISDYLLPKNTFGGLKKFDTSKYEKGPIQWDGIAKKALTEVIPTALLKIYSAITGSEERRYDYNKGKFVKVSSVNNILQEKKLSYARDAGGNLREELMSDLDKDYENQRDNPEYKRLKLEAEKFFINEVLESDDPYILGELLSDSVSSRFKNVDPKILKKLIDIVKDKTRRKKLRSFNTERFSARNKYNESIADDSNRGDSLLAHTANESQNWEKITGGKGKVSPILTDEFNNTLFDYMRGLSKDVKFIAAVLASGKGNTQVDTVIKGDDIKGIKFDAALSFKNSITGTGEKTTAEIDRESDDNLMDLINEGDILDAEKEALKNKKKSFKDKYGEVKGKMAEYFAENGIGIKSIVQAPFNAASVMLTKLSDAMTNVIIGDPADPESGLFGMITKKGEELFETLKEGAKTLFRDKLPDVFDKLFGEKDENGERKNGFFSELYNETKKSLRSGFEYVKDTAKDYAWGKQLERRERYDELIKKKDEKIAEVEERIKAAEAIKKQEEEAKKQEENEDKKDEEAGSGSGLLRYLSAGASEDQNDEEILKKLKEQREKIKNKKWESTKNASMKGNAGLFGWGIKGFYSFIDAIHSANEAMFGEESADNISKSFGSIVKDFKKKGTKGNIGAGALIGMGAGALVGAPMLGTLAGSLIGFAKSSEAAQDFLFGEKDKKGERTGGLFSKEFGETLKKNGDAIKRTGASAVLGATGGLFLGSPVLGAIVGGSIGFVKSSDTAKKILFGDEKEETEGIIPKEILDKFKNNKSLVPLLGAGAGVGALMGGPFGLVGGLAVGAGINYFLATEEGKKKLFGDDKEDGLLSVFKEKVLDKLDEIFMNTANAMKAWLKNTGRYVTTLLRGGINLLFKTGKSLITGLLKTSPAGQAVLGFGTKVASKIGTGLLANRANKRIAKNIAKGYGVYTAKDGQLSSAQIAELMNDPERGDAIRNKVGLFGRRANDRLAQYEEFASYTDEQRNAKIEELRKKIKSKDTSIKEKNIADMQLQQLRLDKKKQEKKPVAEKLQEMLKENTEKMIDNQSTIVEKLTDLVDFIVHGKRKKKKKDKKKKKKKDKGQSEDSDSDGEAEEELERFEGDIVDIEEEEEEPNRAGGFKQKASNFKSKVQEAFKERQKSNNSVVDSNIVDIQDVEPADSKTQTTNTIFGQMQMVKNEQGELEEDTTDRETKTALARRDTFNQSMEAIPKLTDTVSGFGGFFNALKEKLLGGKEKKKKGLFDYIKDFLKWGGEKVSKAGSILSNIFSFISGGKATIGALFKGIIGPALLAAGFMGAFDKIGEAIGEIKLFKGNDTKSTLSDGKTYTVNGELVQVDDNGEPIMNEDGEYLTESGEYVKGRLKSIGQRNSISSNLKRNLVVRTAMSGGKDLGVADLVLSRSAKRFDEAAEHFQGMKENLSNIKDTITGGKKAATKGAEASADDLAEEGLAALREANGLTDDVAENSGKFAKFGKFVKSSKAGKAVGNFAKGIKGKAVSKIDDVVKAGAKSGLVVAISEGLEKVGKALTKMPFFPKDVAKAFPTCIDDISVDLVKKGGPKIAQIAENASNFIPLAGQVIEVVTLVGAGINAWGDAESILGITGKATLFERYIAILVNMINNAIPYIGGLIPSKVIVNILLNFTSVLGLDRFGDGIKELKGKREDAKEEVKAYNKEHGTELSIEEYNKLHGKAGLVTKATDAITGFFLGKKKRQEQKAKMQGLDPNSEQFIENEKAMEAIAEKQIEENVHRVVSVLGKALKIIPFIPNSLAQGLTNAVDTIVAEIVKSIRTNLQSGFIQCMKQYTLVRHFGIHIVIGKAIYGWANAKKVLGIDYRPNKEQRLCSVFASVMGSIFPSENKSESVQHWIEIFKKIAPDIGIDSSKLQGKANEDAEDDKEAEKLKSKFGENTDDDKGDLKTNASKSIAAFGKNKSKKKKTNKKGKVKAKTKSGKAVAGSGSGLVAAGASGIEDGNLLNLAKGGSQQDVKNMLAMAKSGDTKGFMQYQSQASAKSVGDPSAEFISNIPTNMIKYTLLPNTLIADVGHTINESVKNMSAEDKEALFSWFGKNKGVGADVVKFGQEDVGTGDLFSLALEGKVKDFMLYQPKSVSDTDSIGMKLLKNIPSTVAKYSLVGPALITASGKAASKGLSDVESAAAGTDVEGGKDAIIEAAKNGDVAGVWSAGSSSGEEGGEGQTSSNPIAGFANASNIGLKLVATPIALIIGAAKAAGEAFSKLPLPVQNMFTLPVEDTQLALTGHPQELWTNGLTEPEEQNPLGGFVYATNVSHKLLLTPISLMTYAGRQIFEAFEPQIQAVQHDFGVVSRNNEAVTNRAKNGDLEGVWTWDFRDDWDDPVFGFMKVLNMAHKVVVTPLAISSKIGRFIGENIDDVHEKVVHDTKVLNNNNEALSNRAKQGDIEGVWTREFKDDWDDPVFGFTKAISTASKLVHTPVAAAYAVGNVIGKGIDIIEERVAHNVDVLKNNNEALANRAKQGDIAGVWTREFIDDWDDPVFGITKGISAASKLVHTPVAAAYAVSNTISKGIDTIQDRVTHNVDVLKNNNEALKDKANAGDVEGIWTREFKDDWDDPVYGITKGISAASKIVYTPIAAVKLAGNKISETIDNIHNIIEASGKFFTTEVERGKDIMLHGEMMDLLDMSNLQVPESALSDYMKATVFGTRLVGAAVPIVKKAGGLIVQKFEEIKDKTLNNVDMLERNIETLNEISGTGDVKATMHHQFASDKDDPAWGITEGLHWGYKFLAVPRAGAIMLGKQISNKYNEIKDKTLNNIDMLERNIETLNEISAAGDFKATMHHQFASDKDDPAWGITEGLHFGYKFLAVPRAGLVWIGKQISDNYNKLKDKAGRNIDMLERNNQALDGIAAAGDIKAAMNHPFSSDKDDPAWGITEGLHFAYKFLAVPRAGITWLGKAISNKYNEIKDKVINGISALESNAQNMNSLIASGDPGAIMNYQFQNDPENPVGGITQAIGGAYKVVAVPAALAKLAGNKVAQGYEAIQSGINASIEEVQTNIGSLGDMAAGGDLEGLLSYSYEPGEITPLTGINKGILSGAKIVSLFPATAHWCGNAIGDKIRSLVEGSESNREAVNSGIEDMASKAAEGDVDGVWGSEVSLAETDPLYGIWGAEFTIAKMINTGAAAIAAVGKAIKGAIEAVQNKFNDVKSFLSTNVQNLAQGGFDTVQNWLNNDTGNTNDSSSGSGLIMRSGASSGFISQFDGDIADKQMVGGNFATKGCGPSVATMVANSYGVDMDVNDALRDSKSYQNEYGVTLDYFGNSLGRKGIKTKIISGGSSRDIYNSLANGHQAILMGRDGSNVSKAFSPFGPNNHYVLANGLDQNGNVIVSDPELSGPTTYSPEILKSTSYAVETSGGNSRLMRISGAGTKNGFITYDITDADAKGIGYMGRLEQGSSEHAVKAEASLIANKTEKKYGYDQDANRTNLINIATNNHGNGPTWFAQGNSRFNTGQSAGTAQEAQWVKEVLVEGQREFPGYIDEHDWYPHDIATVNGGSPPAKTSLKPGDVIHNNMGSTYTFHSVPPGADDPFGWTKECKDHWLGAGRDKLEKDGTNISGGTNNTGNNGGNNQGQGLVGKVISAFTTGFAPLLGGATGDNSGDNSGNSNTGTNSGGNSDWIACIEAAKAAVAAQQITYNQGGWGDVTVNGKSYHYRHDCTGMVSLYLQVYGSFPAGKMEASGFFTDTSSIQGFKKMAWPGWEGLQKGDIISRHGHAEVFSHNDGGKHMVWNGGGTDSLRSAGPTESGHSSYTTVWRCEGSGSNSNSSSSSSSDNSNSSNSNSSASGSRLLRSLPRRSAAGSGLVRPIPTVRHSNRMMPTYHRNATNVQRRLNNSSYNYHTNSTSNTWAVDNGNEYISGSGSSLLSYDDVKYMSGGATTKRKKKKASVNTSVNKRASNMLTDLGSYAQTAAKQGTVSTETVAKLLKAITKLLETIANNTSAAKKIYDLLEVYTKDSLTVKGKAAALQAKNSNKDKGDDEIDKSLQDLMKSLSAIATG